MDLLDYDYLHDWLKPEDQALAMKLVTHYLRPSDFEFHDRARPFHDQ